MIFSTLFCMYNLESHTIARGWDEKVIFPVSEFFPSFDCDDQGLAGLWE